MRAPLSAIFSVAFLLLPSLVLDVYARDAEAAFEPLELLHVYVADDVDDGDLLRLGEEDGQALDAARFGRGVNFRVVVAAVVRTHADEARPRGRAQLLAYRRDVRVGVLALLAELVAAHVDAAQPADDLPGGLLVRVFVRENLRRELNQEAVHLDVDGVGRLRRETFEAVETKAPPILRFGPRDVPSERQRSQHKRDEESRRRFNEQTRGD